MEKKRKIFWFIQQVRQVGGTEQVTLNLIDNLKDDYDITLVLSDAYVPSEAAFKMPEGVKIISLQMPRMYIRLQDYLEKYLGHFRLLSALYAIFYAFFHFLFGRRKFKKKILSFTGPEDLLIASSLDNYLVMPKGREVYFHYHFNAKVFFSFGEKVMRLFMVKPSKWVFITQGTYQAALQKKKFRNCSAFIYNPIRLTPHSDFSFKGGKIIFLGRYENQKRPWIIIRIAKKLKEDNFPFTISFYGEGPLKNQLSSQVKANGLTDCVFINGRTTQAEKELSASDLLILTSAYEGFPLVIGEANSQSVPVLSSNWGAGVKEAVSDGVNGFIIDSELPSAYAAKIEEIFTDKEALSKLKKTSLSFSSRLSLLQIKEAWKRIL